MGKPLTPADLKIMRKAGKVASTILKRIKSFLKPGISTKDVEVFFQNQLSKHPGMQAAFKGFMGYPAACCVSVNEEIIHGIPSEKVINSGDIVSVDLGIEYKGLFVDTAYTYLVGKVSKEAKRLVKISRKALDEGIKRIKAGSTVGDVSSAVQDNIEKNGFSVIRRFVGHGIGAKLHLEPEVPNFGKGGKGPELSVGMAIAIEPMVSAGSYDVEVLNDGWTAKTADNSLSAHFEHTVAITKKGPIILTR